MPKKLISRVNDASDAVADARAFTWAVFHAAQSENAIEAELSEALLACCNQVLARLGTAEKILEEIAVVEKAKEGAQ